MKKYIHFFALVLFFSLFVCVTSAWSLTVGNVEITAGFDKQQEVTFDKVRTITGVADKGTSIEIKVSNGVDEKIYPIIVGNSRIFSQDIDLELGDNFITVTIKTETDKIQTYVVTVHRIDKEVKDKLEKKGIVLPGQAK